MATRKGRPIADARNILVGSVTPTGTVSPFVGTTAPTGHLSCDGSVVSRTTYSALFAVIGTSHGEGDGSTTFHLPDYRGRFLRGTDESAGRDPDAGSRTAANTGGNSGDAVGAVQDDTIQGHSHGNGTFPLSPYNSNKTNGGLIDSYANSASNPMQVMSDGVNGTARTSSETRPVNINVNYIIKV
jgi:microcystin-dependent protein